MFYVGQTLHPHKDTPYFYSEVSIVSTRPT